MFMFALLCCCLKFCVCQVPVDEPKGPNYIITFDSPVHVTGEGSSNFINTSRIICERYNESTAIMYGFVDLLKEIGLTGKLILQLILKKEASGNHEIVFAHDICEFCDVIGDPNSDYQGYLQYIEVPHICPLIAGGIAINNLIVDMSAFEIQDQHCGAYLAELFMYEGTGENCDVDRTLLYVVKLAISIERED